MSFRDSNRLQISKMTTAKGTIDLDAILEETIQTEKLSDTSKPVEPADKFEWWMMMLNPG